MSGTTPGQTQYSLCFGLWKRLRPKAHDGFKKDFFVLSPASFLTLGEVNPGAFCETAQHAPQRMVRCTDGVGADCAWSSSQDRAVAISSGHSQNRAGQGVQQRQTGSGGAKRGSTPPQRPATVVREEDARAGPSGASTKVSRWQAALSSLGDGDMEGNVHWSWRCVWEQKHSEELPVAHQISRKKSSLVANEKIRLAQVALQNARGEKDHDVREILLAEARLERFLKKVVPR